MSAKCGAFVWLQSCLCLSLDPKHQCYKELQGSHKTCKHIAHVPNLLCLHKSSMSSCMRSPLRHWLQGRSLSHRRCFTRGTYAPNCKPQSAAQSAASLSYFLLCLLSDFAVLPSSAVVSLSLDLLSSLACNCDRTQGEYGQHQKWSHLHFGYQM